MTHSKPFLSPNRQPGISHVEVLVAIVVIGLTLIPALEALQTASIGAGVHESSIAQHYALVARMEEILAEPFTVLDAEAISAGSPSTPTTYSDAPGAENRRLVFLASYDADNADADNDPFTGGDAGLLWVRVEIEGTVQSFESLVMDQ